MTRWGGEKACVFQAPAQVQQLPGAFQDKARDEEMEGAAPPRAVSILPPRRRVDLHTLPPPECQERSVFHTPGIKENDEMVLHPTRLAGRVSENEQYICAFSTSVTKCEDLQYKIIYWKQPVCSCKPSSVKFSSWF